MFKVSPDSFTPARLLAGFNVFQLAPARKVMLWIKPTPREAYITHDFSDNLFLGEVDEIFALLLVEQYNMES